MLYRTLLTLGGIISLIVAIGAGAFVLIQSGGTAYLDNDAKACTNCHIMTAHYDRWTHSSHQAVATCNDCHLPPGRFAATVGKLGNGLSHAYAYLSGNYQEPLRLTPASAVITADACRTCHTAVGTDNDSKHGPEDRQLACTQCHTAVGHAR